MRQGKHEIENSGAAKGHEGDGDENSRKRKKRIHQHHIDEAVDASAVVSGKAANDEAEQKRTRHHAAADEHRNSRAPDQAGKNVASQFVGSSPMLRRGRLQTVRQIDARRILRSNPRREDRGEHEHGHQKNSYSGQRVVAGDARERNG